MSLPTRPAPHPSNHDQTLVRRPWVTVTAREILVKVTNRSFIVSTVLTTFLLIAAVIASGFFAGRASTHTVATIDTETAAIATAAGQAIEASGDALELNSYDSEADLRIAVTAEEVDAGLISTGEGYLILGNQSVDGDLQEALTSAVSETVLSANAQAQGTTLDALREGSGVSTELLSDDAGRDVAAAIAGFAFAFLFYMAALLYGMTIANSVLEEKQNRVVEILATAIPIRQLLYGKVLGNAILAFGQIMLYGIVGLVAVNVAGMAPDIGWIIGASGWFIAFFVFGFLALASVWAVLGSLASRSEDLQSNTGPITGVLVVALFVGIYATGPALTVASFVPVVSSVAMPVRLLSGDVPFWQPLVSLSLTAVAAVLMLRVGERVYQRAVLQGGTALTWRQAFRLEE